MKVYITWAMYKLVLYVVVAFKSRRHNRSSPSQVVHFSLHSQMSKNQCIRYTKCLLIHCIEMLVFVNRCWSCNTIHGTFTNKEEMLLKDMKWHITYRSGGKGLAKSLFARAIMPFCSNKLVCFHLFCCLYKAKYGMSFPTS